MYIYHGPYKVPTKYTLYVLPDDSPPSIITPLVTVTFFQVYIKHWLPNCGFQNVYCASRVRF